MEQVTYREAIQGIQRMFDNIYDYSNGLRDYATDDEKQPWNDLRMFMQGINNGLSRLDNQLNDDRAFMKVHKMRTDDDALTIVRDRNREL
jgi:hypothetical protein